MMLPSKDELKFLKVAELKEHARRLRIPKVYLMKKDELIKVITQELDQIEMEKQEEHRKREEHRGKRDLDLIKQEGVEDLIECLEYPFSCIDYYYDLELSEIPGQPLEDIGDFPHNIKEYYWIFPGANDWNPWMTLCRLDNDVYVFYKGECDYTGFDCQGSMEIYASKDPSVLIHQGMGNWDYDMYMEDVTKSA